MSESEDTSDHYIDVVFDPDLTSEQQLAFLNVLADLFESAGGKGGLRIVSSEEHSV